MEVDENLIRALTTAVDEHPLDINPKPKQVHRENLIAFIDKITGAQIQLMFNVLIVKWVWRSRMLDKWRNIGIYSQYFTPSRTSKTRKFIE